MLDDFEALKRRVDELKERKARAEGAYHEHLKRLKKDYGAKTLAEAEKLLKEFKAKEQAAAGAYLKARKEFDRKWKDVLEGNLQDRRTPEQKERDRKKAKEIMDRFYGKKND